MKIVALLLLLTLHQASGRPWLNSEGKEIEADYISSDAENVTLSMNGKEIEYPINKLSKKDQDWIAEQKAIANTPPPTGMLTNQPISSSLFPEVSGHFKDRTRKASLKAFEGGAYDHASDSGPWLRRDLQKDLCTIYVPESYDGTQPYGLLLYISPSDSTKIPSNWLALLDERKLIAVSAHKTGNKQPMPRRVLLSMEALATVEKTYKIDPNRRIVSGLSGGGHMAMLTAALYPEYFIGAISNAAQSYFFDDPSGYSSHFPGLESKDFKSKERKVMKWIIISGNKDRNYKDILETSKGWMKAGLQYRFIDVPGMAHHNAAEKDFKTALDWIGL